MAQAALEPSSALYELAQSVDLSKVPDKLICKSCQNFLLNGFKTACCEGSICESCNTASTEKPCPLCKHEPFFSNASKAVRGTARSYLKSIANADSIKAVEATPVVPAAPSVEPKEQTPSRTRDSVVNDSVAPRDLPNGDAAVQSEAIEEQDDQADQVMQSIEEPKELSRRLTMDSTSANDPDLDDDIEITVGTYEPGIPKERSQHATTDERDQGWDVSQSQPPSQPRKGSTAQPRQDQNFDNSFGYDNNGSNMDMPNEAMIQMQNFMQMMHQNGMNPQNMPFLSNNPNPNHLQAQMQNQMQSMMQGFMANMSGMQNMGMPMMNMPNWGSGMNGFPNFQGMMPNMMGNGASYNQGPQQFPQNYGDHRPNYNQRNGSFGYQSRGRGKNRGRGRGGAYQHNQQDPYAFGNMPFSNQYGQPQNQFNQGSMNFTQPQYDNNSSDPYATNPPKDHEQHADDNDFAPGGQEEVEEALGEEYKKKTPSPTVEVETEVPAVTSVKDEPQEEPATEIEHVPVAESPAPPQEPEEKDIPEAYREDLGESYSAAPPSAPLGPSAKSVPYRERGHGRFPSRGRGSFHGSNGYAPRSPARPVSQQQTNSPTTNPGFGVIGAPTGPRAMRERDVVHPVKVVPRAESDVGIKIRGTATQPKRDENTRSVTPRSAYDDYDDRERDRDTTSRRHSKYDKKEDSRHASHYSNQNHTQYDEYDNGRDKKRRKSRREAEEDHHENDYGMQDVDMSDSQDRTTSHRDRSRRDRERDKDKSRDKYSSSTSKQHKSSSRRHDDTHDEYDGANDYEPSDERTSRSNKKSSSKHDDREERERRDRDYERAEKDKHRKRSRHDREREDGYEDADEEESRRRSRKHKREHASSRKDRDRGDRDRERERAGADDDSATDLGLRITGRSNKGGNNNQNTNEVPQVDKDPHTLEREARNRERMVKEQQRRENAAKGLSGGRTRTFKYEDEIERSLSRPTKRR